MTPEQERDALHRLATMARKSECWYGYVGHPEDRPWTDSDLEELLEQLARATDG